MSEPLEASAQVVSGRTDARLGEDPELPPDLIAVEAYFVGTTVRTALGGVMASLSPIFMTVAKAADEHRKLLGDYPRCAVLIINLTFDPSNPAQTAELLDYLRQRELELGATQ